MQLVSRGGWHQAQTEMVEAERPLRVETAQHHASTVKINYPAKQLLHMSTSYTNFSYWALF